MNSKLCGLVVAAIVSCGTARAPADQSFGDRPADGRLGSLQKASKITGSILLDSGGKKLAKIKDLVVDLENGRVVEVLAGVGGTLGVGETIVAFPPGLLTADGSNRTFRVDLNTEKLKNGPAFDYSRWDDSVSHPRVAEVYTYYGARPYFGATTNADAGQTVGFLERTGKLIGLPAKNLQGQKLGKIEDLVVDLQAARIVVAVISTGGFLGIDEELSAVPPSALHYDQEHNAVQLDATKESLSSAPHFKSGDRLECEQPDHVLKVYRFYHAEPYFTTNTVDNTALNIRDRDGRAPTPFDQGNSREDIQTTTGIRKAILAGGDFSVNARNVKIITRDGKVVLRGPVNSLEEKHRIGEIAAKVAQPENVDNQLEVRDATASVN